MEEIEALKTTGNDLFKRSLYQEALNEYDKALSLIAKLPVGDAIDGEAKPAVKPSGCDHMASILWSNRSACNLALGEYHEVSSQASIKQSCYDEDV